MPLALLRELVGGGAVAAGVGLLGLFVSGFSRVPGGGDEKANLGETGIPLAAFLARELAQTVVLGFGVAGRGVVVESWGRVELDINHGCQDKDRGRSEWDEPPPPSCVFG